MNKYLYALVILGVLILGGCNTSPSNETDKNDSEEPPVEKTADEVKKGDFIFRIMSEKATYKEGEEIQLYGEIEYVGELEEVNIVHSSSAILYTMEEKTRGYKIEGAVNDIAITTPLKKGVPYREQYEKSGGYSEEDPDEYVAFMKNFFDRKDFPMGDYQVKGFAQFSSESEEGDMSDVIEIEAEIAFKVVD